MGYAARTIFLTHNTIALEPEAFPGWHLLTGECSVKTFDKATIIKLPPMWVRENLCTRLHFLPCCAKRTDKKWMLQRDRDIWQALKNVTNGKFGFKKLQRVDVFFEANPSRMRFPGWTADIIVQGKTKKLDLEGCDMSIKELEKAVADRQAGWIRWKELPGFILRRKEANIEKPSTSSRQEVALDEFGLPVDWTNSDDNDSQGDDDPEYSDRKDDEEPDEIHDAMD
jgi:hypothetical protein